ncbi:hypothetical protein F2P81_023900 [Scophthalmus maximus]|uniref:Uncharacterized protein n=1 Tax=Scophthalmus maximus TaxID=52904 RepID=A0A6A4RV73_SCOMX|nr:hypothetical protein F2P81_023900 [Scophthalmus maximus]
MRLWVTNESYQCVRHIQRTVFTCRAGKITYQDHDVPNRKERKKKQGQDHEWHPQLHPHVNKSINYQSPNFQINAMLENTSLRAGGNEWSVCSFADDLVRLHVDANRLRHCSRACPRINERPSERTADPCEVAKDAWECTTHKMYVLTRKYATAVPCQQCTIERHEQKRLPWI